jgi:hypothetical protein
MDQFLNGSHHREQMPCVQPLPRSQANGVGTTASAMPCMPLRSRRGWMWPRRTRSSWCSSSRTPPTRTARSPPSRRSRSTRAWRRSACTGRCSPAGHGVGQLRDARPELMWLAQMGLCLYRIFDRTEGCERSYRLAERGARLTARGVTLPFPGAAFPRPRSARTVHGLPAGDDEPGMTKMLPAPGRTPRGLAALRRGGIPAPG